MTTARLKLYLKLLAFTVLFFLACGFQTSFWPHLISFVPSPQIWLLMIFFFTLKWPSIFTIFYIYFLGFCLTRFSLLPLKMAWTTLLVTFSVLTVFKNRIQLSGVFSFVIYCLFGSFVFHVSYVLLSDFLEKSPSEVQFIERLLQILMNFIFSYAFYYFFEWLDQLFENKEAWNQAADKQDLDL